MKKAIIILISMIIFCSCAEKPQKPSVPEHTPVIREPEIEDSVFVNAGITAEENRASFQLLTSPITPMTNWLDYEIASSTTDEFIYSEEFSLYKTDPEAPENTRFIPPLDGAQWGEAVLLLAPYSVNSGSIDVAYFYGWLDAGTYRIEKDIFTEQGDAVLLSVNFEVVGDEK